MLPIPQFVKDIYKRNNLRPFESTWLIYVHILGLIGLLYALYRYDIAPKVQDKRSLVVWLPCSISCFLRTGNHGWSSSALVSQKL